MHSRDGNNQLGHRRRLANRPAAAASPPPTITIIPNTNPKSKRIIVRLIAVLAISILVAVVATVVRQHAALPPSPSRTRGAARNIAPLHRRASSDKEKLRLYSETLALENELKNLEYEYMEVTNKITRLKQSSVEKKQERKVDKIPPKKDIYAQVKESMNALERKGGVSRGELKAEGVKQMKDEGQREEAPALVPPLVLDADESANIVAAKKDREPKKAKDYSGDTIPYDLMSANEIIGRIEPKDGRLHESDDLLPVVLPNDIDFRLRLKVRPNEAAAIMLLGLVWLVRVSALLSRFLSAQWYE